MNIEALGSCVWDGMVFLTDLAELVGEADTRWWAGVFIRNLGASLTVIFLYTINCNAGTSCSG